jgi:hypothetical protein
MEHLMRLIPGRLNFASQLIKNLLLRLNLSQEFCILRAVLSVLIVVIKIFVDQRKELAAIIVPIRGRFQQRGVLLLN